MSFQPMSDLFRDRPSVVSDSDIQIYIENFLRKHIRSDALYCSVGGMGKIVRIRIRGPVLAQQVLLLERDLRFTCTRELGCDIGAIRVMLE